MVGTDELAVIHVDFDDPRAARLRAVLSHELISRLTTPENPHLPPEAQAALSVAPEDFVATILVVEPDGTALGHASLRILRGEWEVKRVIVDGDQRGRGVAKLLMAEIEATALAGGARRVVLQTGAVMHEAVKLYGALGYSRIPIFEPYATGIPTSLCFEKHLL